MVSSGQGVTLYGPGLGPGSDIISELVFGLSLSVDALKAGAGQLTVVKAVATAPVALGGLSIIDGYQTQLADVVLLTAQASAVDNGLWLAFAGGWERPKDFAAGTVITSRTVVASAGTTNAGTVWALHVTAPVTVGTTAQTWLNTPDSGVVRLTGDQTVAGNKGALGDWMFKSGRPWKDPGGVGDDNTDNNTSTTGLLQTAHNVAQALPGAGGGKGLIRLERGVFRYTTGITIVTGAIHVKGATRSGTVLKPLGEIVGIDIESSGAHTFEDLTLDGSLLTGPSARLLRLGNAVSFCSFVRVRFVNMPVAVALELFGALDNDFVDCVWSVNNRHILIGPSGSYPSNQNTFRVPKLTDATATTGAAVEIVDSDGNVFIDGLAQGNACLKTILIRNTHEGLATSRANKVRNMWLEANGGVQPASRGISVEGFSVDERIVGTIIDGNQLLSSVQDDPSSQIYCSNTSGTTIDRCTTNLGAPDISVEKGPGNINLHVGSSNTFAGEVQASGTPVIALRKSGGGQSILAGQPPSKVTFNNVDIDNNGNVTSSTFTPDVGGTYRVSVSLEMESVDDQQPYRIHFYKNGSSYRSFNRVTSGTAGQALSADGLVPLAPGDTLEIWLECLGLNSRNVGAGAVWSADRLAA